MDSGRNNQNLGKYDRHPSEVEKLKKELLKKEIEIERYIDYFNCIRPAYSFNYKTPLQFKSEMGFQVFS